MIYNPLKLEDTYYQIVGQTKNVGGTYDAIVKWTYLQHSSGDISGLVAWPWYSSGVTNVSLWMPIPWIY
jgi:hypothetical protein